MTTLRLTQTRKVTRMLQRMNQTLILPRQDADESNGSEEPEGGDAESVDPRLLDAAASSTGPLVGVDMLSADELAKAERLAFDATLVGDSLQSATDRDSVLSALADEGADGGDAATRIAALADRPSYRVLYTQRLADKEYEGRAAEVAIYRYDTGEPVFARVDLETGDVTNIEIAAGAPAPPVPLVRGEIDEAGMVAKADPEVVRRLQDAGLNVGEVGANGLLTGSTENGAACAEHRCVRIFLTSLQRPVPEFAVIIDLVTLKVVEIEDMPGRSLNQ